MKKEMKFTDMRLFTTKQQTLDMINVGYPSPMNQYGQPAYSIGELMNYAKQCSGRLRVIEANTGWMVHVDGSCIRYEQEELVDALVEFCIFIKENKFYPSKFEY